MKDTSELAQRLSEACMRTMLAALALSGLAFALAEKYQDVPPFEAFAKYEIAREDLDAQISDLQSDSCWQLYASSRPNPAIALQVTLYELGTIQCSNQAPGKVKIGSSILSSRLDDLQTPDPPTATNSVTPRGSPATSTPDPAHRDGAPLPMAPVGLEIWTPLSAEGSIEDTLQILWDDNLLSTARKYTGAASMEIYRWLLVRNRLDLRRQIPPKVEVVRSEHPATRSRLSGLQISDLQEINRMAHSGLNDLDRTVRDSFRALLPETTLGVRISTAAEVVSVALCLFMVILAAYVRAAVKCEVYSTRGTVFSVLIGSRWFEVAGFLLICIPAAALSALCLAIGWRGPTGYAVTVFASIVFLTTFSMVVRLAPHTGLGKPATHD
jgi:hypothetical protein